MDSLKWLANLNKYSCPTCGNETIFKSGCSDCDEIEYVEFSIKEYEEELSALQLQALANEQRQTEVKQLLSELARRRRV